MGILAIFCAPLTVPMLRLLSSIAHKDAEIFEKHLEPVIRYSFGIHYIALTEYCQMSTHMPGFQSFFNFFASFCTGKIDHLQHEG